MQSIPQTPRQQQQASFVYHATYGGADGLPPLYGTLQRINSRLVFLADTGELLYPTPEEWYQWGMVHGEVAIAGSQAILDGCRARIERQMLEASNLLPPQAAA